MSTSYFDIFTENGYYLVIEYKNLMHVNILGKTIYTWLVFQIINSVKSNM